MPSNTSATLESGAAAEPSSSAEPARVPRITDPRPAPWWYSKLTVTLLAAAVATIPPSVAAITQYAASAGKLDLAKLEQSHAAQMAFFDKAVDPSRPTSMRLDIMRFLSSSDRIDVDIQKWARDEIPSLEGLAKAEAATAAANLATQLVQLNQAVTTRDALATSSKPDAAGVQAQQQLVNQQSEQVVASEHQALQAHAAAAGPGAVVCDPKRAELQSDLRSGVSETEGTTRCKADAPSHRAGEVWFPRVNGLAVQCGCPV